MRDKLIELLDELIGCGYELHDRIEVVSNSEIADHLIANGVTLAEDNNVLTNGDRIRAMTDGELADFISSKIAEQRFLCDREIGNELSIGKQLAVRHNVFCAWNEWLRQPAKEET